LGQYRIVYTPCAKQQAKKIKHSVLFEKVVFLLDIIQNNPFQNPPPFENLKGELSGAISRRINKKHRFVYQVYEKEKTVKIISMWTHYEIK